MVPDWVLMAAGTGMGIPRYGNSRPTARTWCLGRSESIQSAGGGPRLKGSPGMAVAKLAGVSATATSWPAKEGTAQATRGGKISPIVPHRSQRMPEPGASSGESGLGADSALALQRPPSWPVRTSSASIETGAHNADSTARKPRHAAKRAHTDSGGRNDGRQDTARL